MKKILVLIAALTISVSAMAQDYNQALGLKFGNGVAVTYKTSLNSANALNFEANLSNLFGNSSLNVFVQGDYLWQWGLNVDGLSWYVGPGASVGLVLGDPTAFYLAINGMIGLEYKFAGIPLALSLDWNPGFNVIGGGFGWSGGGLGIKYTF